MADIIYTDGDAVTASSPRLPWNNLIFPGNYVTRLNAYRQQGVLALPGVSFFQQVGAFVVEDSDLTSGELPAGNYDVKILSPDKRQDDKPRLDRNFIVPGAQVDGSGATVYRVAINTVNLKGVGTENITTNPTDISTGVTQCTLTAVAGEFSESGDVTAFIMDTVPAPTTSDVTVGVTTSAALTKIDPSKEAAIILEVCFYADNAAPTADDVNLPFPVESGQSSQ